MMGVFREAIGFAVGTIGSVFFYETFKEEAALLEKALSQIIALQAEAVRIQGFVSGNEGAWRLAA
jgi:hypothetical protein